MSNPHLDAEREIAALLDARVRACLAVARHIRAQRYPTLAMLDKADALEQLAEACTEVSDHLRTPTVGEFLALAASRRELRRPR